MIDNLSFLNNQWFWPIIIAACLLLILFVWKEFNQANKSKLYLKIGLAVLAIASLTLIVLKPIVTVKANAFEMALLTKGYNSNQLDSLKKTNKNLIIKNYAANEAILESDKTPASIYVLGEGVAPFDLWQLNHLNVSYLNTEIPSGIVRLNYKQKNIVGNPIEIKGLYDNAKKGTQLILENAVKTGLDSIVFSSDSSQVFKLSTPQHVVGNYELFVTEKDSLNNIISQNPIGIKITEEQTIRVLIVNGFPTFETKYLKNFLAKNGHEVVIRSQLTRGRFKYEYFNLNEKPLVEFSEKSLESFDLVIIDSQSFSNLGKRQNDALENTIRNQGLGLFIQLNSSFRSNINYITSFNFQSDVVQQISMEDTPKQKITKHPYTLKEQLTQQSIHTFGNKILSAYKPLENGYVGTSVLANTYELVLNGNSSTYKKLWSETINVISKKQIPLVYWDQHSSMNFVNEPVAFKLRTSIEKPIILQGDYHVPIINDIDNNNLWTATTYPKKTGWQTLKIEQDSTELFHYYVNDTTHWTSLKSYHTILANKRAFEHSNTENKPFKSKKEMNLFWLYILFILSIGYLWLEPKL